MIGELILDVFSWIFIEVIARFLVKGPGRAILRLLGKDKEDRVETLAIVAGICFWFSVLLVAIGVYWWRA